MNHGHRLFGARCEGTPAEWRRQGRGADGGTQGRGARDGRLNRRADWRGGNDGLIPSCPLPDARITAQRAPRWRLQAERGACPRRTAGACIGLKAAATRSGRRKKAPPWWRGVGYSHFPNLSHFAAMGFFDIWQTLDLSGQGRAGGRQIRCRTGRPRTGNSVPVVGWAPAAANGGFKALNAGRASVIPGPASRLSAACQKRQPSRVANT